eukprot:GEMP01034320.1.p1 GENE.GEMP01034320.1~~GEMP01034320.1.p1  ORF type:complete len:390 (+),score=113.24 GEMP01034320.1:427-1596(+)
MRLLGATLAFANVYFSEKFDDVTYETRWAASTWKDAQMGSFSLARGDHANKDDADALGLKTVEDAHFFGWSANFPKFSNEGKDLIIQYQLLYSKKINCGGGYIKVGATIDDPLVFGGDTQYNIMFGPDKCGYDKRTHLIFRHHKGEKNVLKKTELPYKQDDENVSHLYRMILKPDNSVKVEIDGEEVFNGSLEKDWELLEPEEIDDPEDKKPDDWVDEAMMDDPTSVKPDDWVDVKRIPDENAKKPEDWDDSEDGEWEKPMIDNPDYKGEWRAEKIKNPEFKGDWKAKRIANPKFEKDDSLYSYPEFGAIGIDVWQVEAGSIFDNIIITDDIEEANKFAKLYKDVRAVEKAKLDAIEAKAAEEEAEKKEEQELGLDSGPSDEEEEDDDE